MPYSTIHAKDNELYSISDLIQWTPPAVLRVIHSGIFNVCNRMLIFGDEGSWKSMLTIHTAVCLANGSDWFGFKTTQCNVLKIQVELPLYSDRERTEKYAKGHELILSAKILKNYNLPEEKAKAATWIHTQSYPSNLINKTATFYHIDESFAYENMKKAIDLCLTELPSGRPLVIILDPLYMLVGGNPNDGAEMKKLLNNIDLAMDYYARKGFYISFILIHHMKKPDTDSNGQVVNGGSNDQSGTRDFQKWSDTVIRLDLDPNNSKRVKFRFTKHRNAEVDLPDLELKWHRETLHPQVTARYIRKDPKDDEEAEIRGADGYCLLEG